MSWIQALTIANLRARRSGVRQRVQACICGCGYTVRAADRVPAGLLS